MDLGIRNRTALITGAASGIGLATARLLAEEGCHLVLWDVAPSLIAVAEELRTSGIDVRTNGLDVVDFETMQRAVVDLQESGQTIQHIVHCAAVGSGKYGFPFLELSPEDWRRSLEVNILGMVHVAQALSPVLIEQRYGTFVFLASVAGQIGSQTDPPYSASKAANINFAQCMAKDLAVHNVRVNTVCPGMVRTPLNQSVWQAWFHRTPTTEQLSYEEWAERKIKQVAPLGRWQTCEDIAAMIVFLSSDRAQSITGQTINVDGGQVMHW